MMSFVQLDFRCLPSRPLFDAVRFGIGWIPQQRDYFAEQPGKVRELAALLENYKTEGRSTPVS
jgi:hypothetical protein